MLSPDRAKLIEEICKGDTSAYQFCAVFVEWCHWIDDVVDKDKLWLPDEVVRVNLRALLVFSTNDFFLRNRLLLMPLIIQAFRAYADSNEWEKRPDVRDRRAADVLKSLYHEIVWHVAYLVGGWDHLKAVTAKYRRFDYDCKD